MIELRVISCIALFLSFPSGMSAQEPLESLGSSVAWRVSPAVPAGTISGLVFSDNGTPVEGAMVLLSGDHHGAVVTGSDGSFSLVHGDAGPHVLEIMGHLGLWPVQEPVTIPIDHGVFVTAILQVRTMHGLCSEIVYTGTPPGDLNVKVVDGTTGLPPAAVVTVRLEHESGVVENSVELTPEGPPYGHVGLGREIGTEGPHVVEVSAPGYRTWRLEDVDLRLVPGCVPTLLNRDHRAELIPLDGG
jgi:hypothetical protein